MRVSVVMPVFNGEKFLRDAIESIISQTFTDWEFIIINEYGSSQAATEILMSYAKRDSRIRMVQNDQKLGISASLNIGFETAQGEYIARMDADDISGELRLERQVAFLDTNPHIALCGIKPEIFGDENWEWNAEIDPKQIRADTLFFIPVLHPTAMFRKSILTKYNFKYNVNYCCSEDYDLFTRMSRCVDISNIPDMSLFRYRRYPSAATYANKEQGDVICKNILAENLALLKMPCSEIEINLLYLHTGLRGLTGDELRKQFILLDLLLKKILQANMITQYYDMDALCYTLHKRWVFAYDVIRYQNYKSEDKVPEKIREIFVRSIFVNPKIFIEFQPTTDESPLVSVVMPVYNGEKYLYEAIYSIITQEYKNWELIVVNDASTDATTLIVEEFAKNDSRIYLFTNEENMRISRTLNRGVDLARGEYIARMDDDDIALPLRLKKQAEFLEDHPGIALVGAFQKHFGDTDWIHSPPASPEMMKASLLFKCEVCHSTVMFRKKDFLDNNLRYNPSFLSEDFELWSRAIHVLNFATIQKVLGEYRWNGDNITSGKADRFDIEAREIVANTLKKYLQINIAQEDMILLSGWTNPFYHSKELQQKHKALMDLIIQQNDILHVYDTKALAEVIGKRILWTQGKNQELVSIEYKPHVSFGTKIKKQLKSLCKRIARPFYHAFFVRVIAPIREIRASIYDISGRQSYLEKRIDDYDGHLWDYKQELALQIQELNKAMDALAMLAVKNQNNNVLEKLQQLDTQVVIKQGEQFGKMLDNRIWKAEEHLSQTFDARIWKMERTIQYEQNTFLYRKIYDYAQITGLSKFTPKIFLLGVPFHSNLGDQAQTYCINEWCKAYYPQHEIIEVKSASDERMDFYPLLQLIKGKMTNQDKIFIHSGSHTTDLFYNEQILTLATLQVFHDRRIVMFPQSIYFENDDKADYVAQKTNAHKNVLFMARDLVSYDIAKLRFNQANVIPMPDIVHLLIGKYYFDNSSQRQGVLFCKRNDVENIVEEVRFQNLLSSLRDENYLVHITDTTLSESCGEIEANRKYYIDRIITEFSKYKVIVTDRMHGTIFALIANTPVIVLGAKEPKVQANVKWYESFTEFKDYVYACESIEEVNDMVKHIMSKELNYKIQTNFAEIYYNKLLDNIECV